VESIIQAPFTSLSWSITKQKGASMVSTLSSSPSPQLVEEFAQGMDPLPPISISPAIFEFLKSLNLQSVGKGLDDVPSILG